jgi:hypothetical protein
MIATDEDIAKWVVDGHADDYVINWGHPEASMMQWVAENSHPDTEITHDVDESRGVSSWTFSVPSVESVTVELSNRWIATHSQTDFYAVFVGATKRAQEDQPC